MRSAAEFEREVWRTIAGDCEEQDWDVHAVTTIIQHAMNEAAADMRERAANAPLDTADKDWVPGSLWEKMARRFAATVRALPLHEAIP